MRLGVLASHHGTNLQAIIDACKNNELDAKVVVVISNNFLSKSIQRAKGADIPAYAINEAYHPTSYLRDIAIQTVLDCYAVDLVILAGYMKLLGPETLDSYKDKVLNSHPSLLPKYGGKGLYGTLVHRAVIESGDDVTGVTIHLVDGQYDHGETIAQCFVPVLEDDTALTLEERVKERERRFWIETLQTIITCGSITRM